MQPDGMRMLTLAGAAGGWIVFARITISTFSVMLIVIGTVVQVTVADAMGAGARARRRQCPAGRLSPRRARHGPGNRPPGAVGGILAVAGASAGWR